MEIRKDHLKNRQLIKINKTLVCFKTSNGFDGILNQEAPADPGLKTRKLLEIRRLFEAREINEF